MSVMIDLLEIQNKKTNQAAQLKQPPGVYELLK